MRASDWSGGYGIWLIISRERRGQELHETRRHSSGGVVSRWRHLSPADQVEVSMGGGIKGRRGGTSKLPVQDPPALDLEQETLEGGFQSPCYADVLKLSHCNRLISKRPKPIYLCLVMLLKVCVCGGGHLERKDEEGFEGRRVSKPAIGRLTIVLGNGWRLWGGGE
ncbi:hypothetical protein JOQ06_023932, partial [Pogonophryne albipinna]